MAEANFQNRTLYHGDNLDFLRGMNSETVHLIATDPPFNKNRDFHATPDSLARGARFSDRWSWERDVHEEWTDSIKDDWPAVWEVIDAALAAYGKDMGAFLCWLGVRLMEMHRVLRADGSLYLHCDPTASHYIKAMLDAIFGRKNFRNEIVWKRTWAHNDPNRYGRISDSLFYYTKGDDYIWNRQYTPYSEDYIRKFFRYKDERGRFRAVTLTGPKVSSGESGSTWRGYSPTSSGRSWSVPKRIVQKIGGDLSLSWPISERLDLLDKHGYIYWPPKGSVPHFKQYLLEMPGVPVQNMWVDVDRISPHSKERTGYPTQKPLALYERIIRASSNEGDIVLDPFCGCATTPVAAEQLKRQWVGMDIWDGARDIVLQRLQDEWLFTSEGAKAADAPPLFPHTVSIKTEPPTRTDDNEIAAPTLKLRIQRPVAPWQKISHRDMMNILAEAQGSGGGVICGGCGRVLEREFMQLDHITPKSDRGENHILNRILLCGPCNRRKRDNLTLRGLLRENKKKAVGWMNDEGRAKLAQEGAHRRAQWVRDNFDTPECQALLDGRSSSR